ncbi:putative signal peptide protein [Puccinia sorghi]|uniref:Putative signal peptide protein n=1 Tax=Puccinia sorghi TaxID=27349 RepID=A0A0L6UNZ5_9BASI|nr:putative signal peptide protein [Puccinia sorghi]
MLHVNCMQLIKFFFAVLLSSFCDLYFGGLLLFCTCYYFLQFELCIEQLG